MLLLLACQDVILFFFAQPLYFILHRFHLAVDLGYLDDAAVNFPLVVLITAWVLPFQSIELYVFGGRPLVVVYFPVQLVDEHQNSDHQNLDGEHSSRDHEQTIFVPDEGVRFHISDLNAFDE